MNRKMLFGDLIDIQGLFFTGYKECVQGLSYKAASNSRKGIIKLK